MANNMDLDINVRTKSDSAAINKLTQSIDNLRKKARELENIGSGKGLNKALGDNAKLVDRITDQFKVGGATLKEIRKQVQGLASDGKLSSAHFGQMTKELRQHLTVLRQNRNISAEETKNISRRLTFMKEAVQFARREGEARTGYLDKIKVEEARIADIKLNATRRQASAEQRAAEKRSSAQKSDERARKAETRHEDRKVLTQERLAQGKTRIDQQERYRQDVNRREESGNHRRRQEALTQYERQLINLGKAEAGHANLVAKTVVGLRQRSSIEQTATRAATNDFAARTRAAANAYRTDLAGARGSTDEIKRQRILARERYNTAVQGARNELALRMKIGREESRAHERSERERLREDARLRAQASQGFSRFGSSGSQALSYARQPAYVGAAIAGSAALAARRGVGEHMNVDDAETNLMAFGLERRDASGNLKSMQGLRREVQAIRSGFLDEMSLRRGVSNAAGLSTYNEVLKAGIKDPKAGTDTVLKGMTGLELNRDSTTTLIGIINRIKGDKATPQALHSAINAIAVAAKEDPTKSNEIVEGMNRGWGALAVGNLSVEELAGFVSGGQSAGIDPGKAGTFMAAIGKHLNRGSLSKKMIDPSVRTRLNKASRMAGFAGGGRELARLMQTDTKNTILRLLDSMAEKSEKDRAEIGVGLFGDQWSDEFSQMLLGRQGMKRTLAQIEDPKNANVVDEIFEIKMRSWRKQWDQVQNVFGRFWDSIGVGLTTVFEDATRTITEAGSGFRFSRISDAVESLVGGFLSGLGFASIGDMIKGLFGDIDADQTNTNILLFAKGMGEGFRAIGTAVKDLLTAFAGSNDPAKIGELTAKIIGLSAALVLLSPVIGTLGLIITAVTAFAGLVKGLSALIGLAGARAAIAGGASGAAATAAGGAAMAAFWSSAGILLATAFVKHLSTMAADWLDKKTGSSIAGSIAGMAFKPFGAVGYLYDLLAGGEKPEAGRDISPEGTRKVIESLQKEIERLNETLKKSKDNLSGSTGDDGLKGSQGEDRLTGEVRRLVQSTTTRMQLAALTGGAVVTGSGGGVVVVGGGGGGGAGGIPSVPGVGGILNARPGQRLGPTTLGRRGIIGGAGGAGGGSGMPDPSTGAGIGPYKGILDHIAQSEGTARAPGGGYNTSLGYGKFLPGGKEQNLTGLTLDQIDALQSGMLNHPQNGYNSSAIGRYQIVRKTLRGLRRKLGLRGDQVFDEAMQDRLGAELVRQRGASPSGLANEWASLRGDKLRKAVGLAQGIPQGSSTAPGARPAAVPGGAGSGAAAVGDRIRALKESGVLSNQQCVALAKAYVGLDPRSGANPVTSWRRGEAADAGTLKPGTPVATFLNRDGSQSDKYDGGVGIGKEGNKTTHAAVFQDYIRNKDGKIIGMNVVEQYRGSGGPRTKQYMFNNGKFGTDNGSNYHAVMENGGYLGGKNNPMAQAGEAATKAVEATKEAADSVSGAGIASMAGVNRLNNLVHRYDVTKPKHLNDPGAISDLVRRYGPGQDLGMNRIENVPLKSSPEDLAGGVRDQAIAKGEDRRALRDGAAGGKAMTVQAPITIQGSTNPEHVANRAAKHIQDSTLWRTHDQDFASV